MKDLFIKLVFDWLNSHKVSLALIVGLWLMLSPSYNNFIQLITKVEAHTVEITEIKKFNFMLNEKFNLLMLENGINKEKIKAIENRYYKQQTEGDE